MDLKKIGMLFFLLGLLFWVTSYCVGLSAATLSPASILADPNKASEVNKSAYYLSITATVFMWLGAAASLFGQMGGEMHLGT